MDDILSVINGYAIENAEDVGLEMACNFRHRRIERGLTREQVAEMSGVPIGNLARFEQKGLISLKNLAALAMGLGYLSELKSVFSQPKYETMEELTQIRRNMNKKRGHRRHGVD